MVKISIVTVTYNCEKLIEKTLKSILNQKYLNYEYIIIDGKSKDSTLDIIKKYKEFFIEKKIDIKIISEKDTGIYNAMNKSLNYINGQWIFFLNSGDYFFNDLVLEELDKLIENVGEEKDVIFGNICEYKENKRKKISISKNIDYLKNGMPFSHQGNIVKARTLKKYKFDEKYKLAADYKFYRRLYIDKASFYKTDLIFSNYELSGVSTNYEKVHLEYLKINLEDKKFKKSILYNFYMYTFSKIKNKLKKI